jgi:recombination protein RecT
METSTALTVKNLFGKDEVRNKFQELLGKRAPAFITSVLQIVASNHLLAKADPHSVYHAAAVAATLDLPLNNQLGFAYIVPFNQKQQDGSYKQVAQFQLGYKGFIQLAQRSGQFQTISASPIFEGQLVEQNPLTGFVFDFKQKKSENIIGYAAYFRLLNGFEKTLFMTVDQANAHGKKYSQTYKKGYGLWKDEFDVMAIKTVIKGLLAKFAPMSIEMQKAVIADQAVINDSEATDVTYVDNNEHVEIDKEKERIRLMIEDAKTVEQLENISMHVEADQLDLFTLKMDELKTKSNGAAKQLK